MARVLGIDIPNEYIAIQHFDIQQVNEWIEHYTSNEFCGKTLKDEIKDLSAFSTSEDSSSDVKSFPALEQ